uniref:G-protein coupled receptors family 1 profile domain-containing protein n=1 Tax=Branchiostoma floridae TaxID=7739 RepID=C3ZQG6_BRAFL|eukprot:XP_002589211.1 hypothetical protein BRAFLDRAFT_74630 [Branchiostoma floridae]
MDTVSAAVIAKAHTWPAETVMLGMHHVMNATDYDNNNATFAAWNFQRNGTTDEEVEFSGFETVAVVIAAIGIAGFLSNGAVVLLFLKFRQLRTPFNMLLLNMSVADLLVSVCGNTLSFASAVRHRWLWGRPGCVWYGFANHLFGLVSLISLAVISYERYRMVVKPKGPGSSYLTYNKVGLAIIFIYLYCLLWTTLPIVGWSSYQLEGPKISCSVAWEEHSLSNTSYIVAIFIMCLLLPLLIIIYSYCRLWYKVKKFRRYFQDLLCCGRRLFDASASVNTCNTSAMPRHSPVFQKPDSDQYNGIQKSSEPQMKTTGQNATYRQWIEMQTIAVVVKADDVNNGEVKT